VARPHFSIALSAAARVANTAMKRFLWQNFAPSTPITSDSSSSTRPAHSAGSGRLVANLGERDAIEAHPRANRRKLRAPAPQSAQRLGRELRALEHGGAREADETDKPLPERLGCGATRRNVLMAQRSA